MRQELKERFIQELSASEKAFFLSKAREALSLKGYPASEDLYYYCYFLTLRERIRRIDVQGGEGYMRFLVAAGIRDVEETIKMYQERLEKKKRPIPDPRDAEFIEYFSE